VCSVLALSIIIERFVNLRTARVAPPDLFNQIIARARAKALTNDEIAAWETGSLLGMVLSSPMRYLKAHPRCSDEELKEAMQNAGQAAAMRLDQYLSALGTIASVAPLLGLLGTVVGMIDDFLAHKGPQAPLPTPRSLRKVFQWPCTTPPLAWRWLFPL
jgi:biopolymer transport protein ExbB